MSTTEPSRSGKQAANASTNTVWDRVARSPASATPVSNTMAAPQAAISHSKTSRKPSSSSLRSAGSTNTGSAPGGYSGRMSRYGTDPSSIALPYVS